MWKYINLEWFLEYLRLNFKKKKRKKHFSEVSIWMHMSNKHQLQKSKEEENKNY